MKNYARLFKCLLTFGLILWNVLSVQATHNRAGEITYEQIGPLTIRATITTYTRTSSFSADRDSLEMFWGDGSSNFISRSNGNGDELPNDIKVNYYTAEHTYPTRSTYKLSVTDPNRIAGILNIDFPNSVNIKFYIETTLTLLDTRFQGVNNSAILLQPPIDFACVDQTFTHNPNAYDPDGDSLAYEFIVPFQEEGVEVPNYNLPDEISAGPQNILTLDEVTGDIVWDSPKVQGEFNLTILIKEYREGILINQIIRDMQILVRSCQDENVPPTIETVDEICVIAGELVNFDVIALDADSNQTITLTALGGPFELDKDPANINITSSVDSSKAEGTFTWQTTCAHISEEAYQVVFRASDDYFGDESGLATLKTIRIKVLGPAPQNVIAEKVSSSGIRISWDSPYDCDTDSLFQGFSVWRKIGSKEIEIDSCQGGLLGQGYEEIIFLTNEKENDRYFAIDMEVDDNAIYCYRILGEFAQVTASQNLFNRSESLPSNESCERFDRKDPLITKVSVLETNESSGQIELNWILPIPDDIDTLLNVGPYTLQVERANGINGTDFQNISGASFTKDKFSELTGDTLYIDQNVNTEVRGYNYRISFSNLSGLLSRSSTASSVYSTAIGKDHFIDLNWEFSLPWNNYEYHIYDVLPDGNRGSLKVTTSNTFTTINDLLNGEEYCYVIESIGKYGLIGIKEPLINDSQIVCTTPTDSIAPCAPGIIASTQCEQDYINPDEPLVNVIRWSFEGDCRQASDLQFVNVYYRANTGADYDLLSTESFEVQEFSHTLSDNIAGCYALTAIDSSGNESELGEEICVDNCPFYSLPNAFTPNNDQSNDNFTPIINRFIDRIEMEVYNRWGQVVFRTTESEINWDGTNLSGNALSDGTYYYTCRVFENRVDGIIEQVRPLQGYIQIITGN